MAAIYQADVWCDDCADAIRADLRSKGCAPEDPTDECSFDSDDYPKHASDDDAADSPQHCAAGEECFNAIELPSGRKIGQLLGGLTPDGVDYVRKTAVESDSEVSRLWVQHFTEQGWDIVLDKCSHCGGYSDPLGHYS
jgi:hypothetical protein